MGAAAEVVIGRVVNPGAAVTALTPGTGQSFAVRALAPGGSAYVDDLWAKAATAGVLRLRSNRLHDPVQGIRFRTVAGVSRGFFPDELRTPVYSVDQLTFEMSGGAAETDLGALLAVYSDLDGIDARFASWAEIQPRIRNALTIEVATAAAAVAGDWSGGAAINSTFDLLKADGTYALLGYQTDVPVGAVAVQGADTGNIRTGGPGTSESIETRDWWLSLSLRTGLPLIPIIKANNRGATLVFVADSAANTVVNVGLIAVELSG